jgi:hypothetical protein
MEDKELKALQDFCKFLDNERNNETLEMWSNKAIWGRKDAFQEYLNWYLHKRI